MWAQYKKTFVPVQLFIIGVCLVFVFAGHAKMEALIAPLVVMEIGAVYGAKWAWRIRGGRPVRRDAPGPMTPLP